MSPLQRGGEKASRNKGFRFAFGHRPTVPVELDETELQGVGCFAHAA
jgi:hypothetical protein